MQPTTAVVVFVEQHVEIWWCPPRTRTMDHGTLQSPDHVSGMIWHWLCIHHPPHRTVPEQTKDNTYFTWPTWCDLTLSWQFRSLELAYYKCSKLLTYLLKASGVARNLRHRVVIAFFSRISSAISWSKRAVSSFGDCSHAYDLRKMLWFEKRKTSTAQVHDAFWSPRIAWL